MDASTEIDLRIDLDGRIRDRPISCTKIRKLTILLHQTTYDTIISQQRLFLESCTLMNLNNHPFYSIPDKENGGNSKTSNTEQFCQQLVDKVTPDSPLPKDCQKFPTVVKMLQRRNSDRSNHAKAFAGMSPGEMAAAMKARERGQLNHAQIQRRLTTRRL